MTQIEQVINKIGSLCQQIIKNQSVLNNKLDYLIQNNPYNFNGLVIDNMTPRQLYKLFKRGWTYQMISSISGYEVELVDKKITTYIEQNT